MLKTRVIPVLLLDQGRLVKGKRFKRHRYVGDPINAVKIFNDKGVDELVFLDIAARKTGKGPDFALLADIAEEAFMPFAYGGGINSIQHIERLFRLGIEKVILNTSAYENPKLVEQAVAMAGSSSIVAAMDVTQSRFGAYQVRVNNARTKTGVEPVAYAKQLADLGVGELLVTAVKHEGCACGYDLALLHQVSQAVDIPVIAAGGAGSLQDMADVVRHSQVSAVAAGQLFVFHGKHQAVLINYPNYDELVGLFH